VAPFQSKLEPARRHANVARHILRRLGCLRTKLHTGGAMSFDDDSATFHHLDLPAGRPEGRRRR
jgi:hypothetical protein